MFPCFDLEQKSADLALSAKAAQRRRQLTSANDQNKQIQRAT